MILKWGKIVFLETRIGEDNKDKAFKIEEYI